MGSLFKAGGRARSMLEEVATSSRQKQRNSIPVLPDEEELRRVKRREAARRSGSRRGRASTILSDQRLGG